MTFQITAIYASLLAILFVFLSFRVAQRRIRFRVGLGTGENAELERAIRIQGNFAEYVPLALLLLAFFESGGAAPWAALAAGGLLLLARVLHAIGLTGSSGRSPGRLVGATLTWFVLLALALGNLALRLGPMAPASP